MSSARFFVVPAIALAAFACTGSGSGPGGVVEAPTESRDPPGPSGAPESPGAGSGQESPGSGGGRESPGSNGTDPGQPSSGGVSSSGGASSSGSAPVSGGSCSYCNKTYTCTGTTTTGGQSQSSSTTTTLTEVGGQCEASTDEDGGAPAIFSCNGTISEGGQTIDWTADGSGGFSFSENLSYTVNGQTETTTVDVVCNPTS
jgi:hypothetical protein